MSCGWLSQREEGVTVKQVAKDFGISESCLTNWMTQADRDAGVKTGAGSRGAGRVAGCQAPDPVAGAGERGAAPRGGVPVAGEPLGQSPK
jgi:transposase-like protein